MGTRISVSLWANPIFASFWVVSNKLADALSLIGSDIGALLLAFSVIIYHQNTNRRTGRVSTDGLATSKLGMSEFYEDYWQKKLLRQAETENDENNPFVMYLPDLKTYAIF